MSAEQIEAALELAKRLDAMSPAERKDLMRALRDAARVSGIQGDTQ
jgi:hypothetical protein